MALPSMNVEQADGYLITLIAERATRLALEFGFIYPLLEAEMDVTACHANGCPLQLRALLRADVGNFGHDVFGIRRHISRRTGKLGGQFVPRYAEREARTDG